MSSAEIKEAGGVYTLFWDTEVVSIRLDRLVEDSKFTVTGEILVRLANKHVHQARMNLTSTQARAAVVRQCQERHPSESIDWNSFIEEASIVVLELFRAGPEAIDFTDYHPPMRSKFRLTPFLLDNEPNLFFGPGGSGKSYLAAFVAAHISKGYVDQDGIEVEKAKVLYLDYETGPEEIYQRMTSVQRGLGMDSMPEIIYHPSSHPLASEISKIQRMVAEHDIELVIVDSVGYACGGEPETAVNALAYYNALRQLNTTSLSIGHVSKDRQSTTPFGSVFWVNGARHVWEVVRSQEAGDNHFSVGILNRKINNGPLMLPVGYKLSFENDAVYFDLQDVKMIGEAEEKLPLKERMVYLLQEHELLEVKDIAAMLERAEGTVRKTLHRHPATFFQYKNGSGPVAWKLNGSDVAVTYEDEDIFGPAHDVGEV